MSKSVCAVVVACAGLAVPAGAEVVIGTFDFFGGFGAPTLGNSVLMGFGMIADDDPSLPENRIFAVDEVLVSPGVVGTTWTASDEVAAAMRAHFADDDLDDALGFYAYFDEFGISGRLMEGDFGFTDLDLDVLARHTEGVRITLLMWEPLPGSQPGWSDFLLNVRYEFLSSVPAPGPGALLTAAALLASRRRR